MRSRGAFAPRPSRSQRDLTMTVSVQTNADNPQTNPMLIKEDSQKNYSCLPPQLISGSGPESLAGDLKFSPLHLPSPAYHSWWPRKGVPITALTGCCCITCCINRTPGPPGDEWAATAMICCFYVKKTEGKTSTFFESFNVSTNSLSALPTRVLPVGVGAKWQDYVL